MMQTLAVIAISQIIGAACTIYIAKEKDKEKDKEKTE